MHGTLRRADTLAGVEGADACESCHCSAFGVMRALVGAMASPSTTSDWPRAVDGGYDSGSAGIKPLSAPAFRTLLHQLGMVDQLDPNLDGIFIAFDHNKDGELDADEVDFGVRIYLAEHALEEKDQLDLVDAPRLQRWQVAVSNLCRWSKIAERRMHAERTVAAGSSDAAARASVNTQRASASDLPIGGNAVREEL